MMDTGAERHGSPTLVRENPGGLALGTVLTTGTSILVLKGFCLVKLLRECRSHTNR